MQSTEVRATAIDVVAALTQVEIDDVDGEHLLHLLVLVARLHVVGDDLRRAVQHTIQVAVLPFVLHLDNHLPPVSILTHDVDTVVLVRSVSLIPLAFQEMENLNILLQEYRQKSLQHNVVGLVAQQAFHRPVESDVLTHNCRKDRGKN